MNFISKKGNVVQWAMGIVLALGSGQPARQLVLTNPLKLERKDELVVLKRNTIEKKLGSIPAGQFITLKEGSGHQLDLQFDDLNADGKWDEVVFLYSFRPLQHVSLVVALTSHDFSRDAVVRAHVRQRKKNPDDTFGPILLKDTMPMGNPPTDFSKVKLPPYLTEGPAWENDKVAFRAYFDTRNAYDIFGKLTARMVMDSVGATTGSSYHDLHDWGMDLLHVGKSLGAGSVAIATKDLNGKDTLIRLGGKQVKSETYEVLADGPIRSKFILKYSWENNGKPVEVNDIISIWGGQYFYEAKLIIKEAPPGSRLVTGIANFNQNNSGLMDTAGCIMVYSYGPQSENKDNLGLAIAIPKKDFQAAGKTGDNFTDVQHSYTLAQKINTGREAQYRFYAGWNRSDREFESEPGFVQYLKKEASKYQAPITIHWK